MATQAQIEKQKKLGLEIGCDVCFEKDKKVSVLITYKLLNPFCVGCNKLYCAEHESKIDAHFCIVCLPNPN